MSLVDSPPRGRGFAPTSGRSGRLGRWGRKLAVGVVLIALPVLVTYYVDTRLIGPAWGTLPAFLIAPDHPFINVGAVFAFAFAAGVGWALLRLGERTQARVANRKGRR